MDFLANNWVFILILVLFVGMHLVSIGEKPDSDALPSRRGIGTHQIPSSQYSPHDSGARRLKAGTPGVRHASIRKGDQ
jgi:hypothetical protein